MKTTYNKSKREIMDRPSSNLIRNSCSLLLLLTAADGWACGTGGSGTIGSINTVPTLGGSFMQVNALGAGGQFGGYSYTTGDLAAHAFRFSNGSMLDLGTLGGNISQVLALNSSGQAAGDSTLPGDASTSAFFHDGSNLINLGTLGGSYSSATALNDNGLVVGSSFTLGDATLEAFKFSNGTMTSLGTLGGSSSSASAVNNSGAIIGDSSTSGDAQHHAFLYSGGTMADLGTLGGVYSSARGLNAAGQITGEATTAVELNHAFLYSGGSMMDLGTLGGSFSTAKTLNSAGQVIGISSTLNDLEYHGFIYKSGAMTDLGTLGGNYSTPQALNNLGQVVGDSANSNGMAHAFLWSNGSMVDLNSLLPTNSGWTLSSGEFINDAGTVVGIGTYNGVDQVFRLTLSSGGAAPVAVAGPNQTTECPVAVTLNGSASTGDSLSYQWSEGANVLGTNVTLTAGFDLGIHTLTLTVSDPCGASSHTNVQVTVVDTTAPVIQTISVTPSVTNSCNDDDKVCVKVAVAAVDNCDAAPVSKIISITSNQRVERGDILITGALTARLAASNEGRTSRTYTITVQTKDASGNISTATITVQPKASRNGWTITTTGTTGTALGISTGMTNGTGTPTVPKKKGNDDDDHDRH
jgi:probable HAF family extracellular repeat protein